LGAFRDSLNARLATESRREDLGVDTDLGSFATGSGSGAGAGGGAKFGIGRGGGTDTLWEETGVAVLERGCNTVALLLLTPEELDPRFEKLGKPEMTLT
jgi:hypothetical protein